MNSLRDQITIASINNKIAQLIKIFQHKTQRKISSSNITKTYALLEYWHDEYPEHIIHQLDKKAIETLLTEVDKAE